jgi:hypothetical protein
VPDLAQGLAGVAKGTEGGYIRVSCSHLPVSRSGWVIVRRSLRDHFSRELVPTRANDAGLTDHPGSNLLSDASAFLGPIRTTHSGTVPYAPRHC